MVCIGYDTRMALCEVVRCRRYLLWKNDGNAIGKPTYIYLQRLSADGMSLAGNAVALIRNTEVLCPLCHERSIFMTVRSVLSPCPSSVRSRGSNMRPVPELSSQMRCCVPKSARRLHRIRLFAVVLLPDC